MSKNATQGSTAPMPDPRSASLTVAGKPFDWEGTKYTPKYTVSPSDIDFETSIRWSDVNNRVNNTYKKDFQLWLMEHQPAPTYMSTSTVTGNPAGVRTINCWRDGATGTSTIGKAASMILHIPDHKYTVLQRTDDGAWTAEPVVAVVRNDEHSTWSVHAGLRVHYAPAKTSGSSKTHLTDQSGAETTFIQSALAWANATRTSEAWRSVVADLNLECDHGVLHHARSQLMELAAAGRLMEVIKIYQPDQSQEDVTMEGADDGDPTECRPS